MDPTRPDSSRGGAPTTRIITWGARDRGIKSAMGRGSEGARGREGERSRVGADGSIVRGDEEVRGRRYEWRVVCFALSIYSIMSHTSRFRIVIMSLSERSGNCTRQTDWQHDVSQRP